MNYNGVGVKFGDFNKAYGPTVGKFTVKLRTATQRNIKKRHGKNTVISKHKRRLIKFNKKSSIKKLRKALSEQVEKRATKQVDDMLFDMMHDCVTVN